MGQQMKRDSCLFLFVCWHCSRLWGISHLCLMLHCSLWWRYRSDTWKCIIYGENLTQLFDACIFGGRWFGADYFWTHVLELLFGVSEELRTINQAFNAQKRFSFVPIFFGASNLNVLLSLSDSIFNVQSNDNFSSYIICRKLRNIVNRNALFSYRLQPKVV